MARVLAMLEEALNEGGQWGPDKNRLHAGQVEAAGEDLLLIADYLDEVAESRELNHLSIDEWRICDQAATSAEEVRRIGTTLVERARYEPRSSLLAAPWTIRASGRFSSKRPWLHLPTGAKVSAEVKP